ncbi:MAG: hypothetical protein F6K19_46735, partial [Cyanothece sp. SIO1E1]|nr:hypothetical protein [Cyanothece sp. SIO1E1]
KDISRFRYIKAWIYFNQIQPDIVPLDIGQPNWALNRGHINLVLREWRELNNGVLSAQNMDKFFEP